MVDIFLSFQINIFANTANIKPDTSTIAKLLELFKDYGFIPNTIQEIGPRGQTLRLRMSSPDNRWNIVFMSSNINIALTDVPNKTGNEMDDFLTESKKIAKKIFDYLNQKSNRLAFIVNAMLKEKTKAELESFYNKLFIPLPKYKSNPPFEWDNRSVSIGTIPLAGTMEEVNIITAIKRMQGQMIEGSKTTDFDRAHLLFEFNTVHNNKETRFGVGEIESFLDIAKDNYCEIAKELEGIINV